jgi:hypothetical protein
MTRWPLYAVVALMVVATCAALTADPCGESENGEHEDVLVSDDDAVLGRRWRMRCLHCWRPTHGWRIPWLRTSGGTR